MNSLYRTCFRRSRENAGGSIARIVRSQRAWCRDLRTSARRTRRSTYHARSSTRRVQGGLSSHVDGQCVEFALAASAACLVARRVDDAPRWLQLGWVLAASCRSSRSSRRTTLRTTALRSQKATRWKVARDPFRGVSLTNRGRNKDLSHERCGHDMQCCALTQGQLTFSE